ncbi:tyrosine-protein phosphatase [Bacteroides sp. 224]|uniref:tyrosine-protein phosphatase n=1 Tax=Bacteroides sp. 224 TaxID=2302936 RepID=UPI0013D7AB4F|nr:tyrosine-protein phosphatase [Bacteroides sp. 224]NDV64310.1 tyrosine-protein phosphatase [Bacteroides sp. 224]
MYKYLLGWFAVAFFSYSCSDESPDISVVCEENSVGNCIVKWETTPAIEGKVKIYVSTNPDHICENDPVATADISDQRIIVVTSDPTQRYYYKMVFNNRYRVTTASRNTNIPGIQNFRDIGGYAAAKGKQVRWGKLYRSAEFGHLPCSSYKELKNIGIKTIVDLRNPSEVVNDISGELENEGFRVVRIPINILNTKELIGELRKGRVRNDSINRLVMRLNRDLVTYYRAEYKEMFDVLLEKKNYPVLIHCTSGKGRTAIASALILAALGVNNDQVLQDYRSSNDYFDIPKFSNFAYGLPSYSQEAITTLFSAREGFLNAAKYQIEKSYGDMPTFLKRGLGLTSDDIDDLKGILLR